MSLAGFSGTPINGIGDSKPVRVSLPLVGIVALALLAGPSSGGFLALTPPDAQFLIGRLAWNAGAASISWAEDVATEDPGGPPIPAGTDKAVADARYMADQYGSGYAGVTPFPYQSWTFQAAPLAESLFLNVTRHIELDLFLTGCSGYDSYSSPKVAVELWAGTTRIAGGWPDAMQYFFFDGLDGAPYPRVPPGHCLRLYRMMPETHLLAAGTVLTLKLFVVDQSTGHRIGMADDHASLLRLPFYPADEVVYRYPEAFEEDAAEGSAGDESRGGGLVLAGIAALALAFRPRSSRWLLLLLVPVLAGCLEGGNGPGVPAERTVPSGRASSDLLPDPGGNLTNASTGSILGSVKDDLGLPVRNAHAFILGSSFFTKSSSHGRFQFLGLPPGSYVLRVDHEEYESLETGVEVVAGSILRLDVELVPAVPRESDDRPHRHDYWLGETTKALPEIVLEKQLGWRLAPPALVLPGARLMEVTISWTMPSVSKVWMAFEGPHEGASFHGVNYTPTYLFRSGETVRIPLSWEMTDAGHQPATAWGDFYLNEPNYGDGGLAAFPVEALETYVYRVKIVLHKGIVPFEAPHADHWGSNTTLPIMTNLKSRESTAGLGGPLGDGNYSWMSPRLIPPGTGKLEIKLKASRASTPAFDWILWYKDARVLTTDQHGGINGDFRCQANMGGTSGRAAVVGKDAAKFEWTFKMDLVDGQADPFYARRSDWCFWASPTNSLAHYADSAAGMVGLSLTVVAHKQPG